LAWADDELTGLDLETTGTDPFTARPVSYALVQFDADTEMATLAGLVNPGVPIPPEATAVHGITDAMVLEPRGWPLDAAVSYLCGLLAGTWSRGVPVVGMNLAYDLTVLRTCKDRVPLLTHPWIEPKLVIDLMVLDKHVDRYRKGSRKLGALCDVYNVELSEAHNAHADVVATVLCLRELAGRYPEVGEMDLPALHLHQMLWHHEQMTGLSEYFVATGQAPVEPHCFSWPTFSDPTGGNA
jgi:DNA polymerase-3 subunit epsilon